MTKVLEFYHKSFGKSLSTFEVSKAFELEVGEWCTSGEGCYQEQVQNYNKKLKLMRNSAIQRLMYIFSNS
jgi:hypothetical protein